MFWAGVYEGPSIYDKGILKQLSSPLKARGDFIPFSDINQIKIGLVPGSREDVSFGQRFAQQDKYNAQADLKELLEELFDDILIEVKDGHIHHLTNGLIIDLPRFETILKEKGIRYSVNPEILE